MTGKFRLAALAIVLGTLTACASMRTIIADFDIDGSGQTISADGAGSAGSAKLDRLAPPQWRASPFPDLRYTGPLHSADLMINSDGIEASITNTTQVPIVLRFDRATLSSNLQPDATPLGVFNAQVKDKLVYLKKGESVLLAPPAMPLAPGERAHASLHPSYIKLFPSKRLFGVQFDGKQPVLLENGVGNTVTLRVPVEHAGVRSTWVLELTARQTSVRSNYR